jgi:putative transposase
LPICVRFIKPAKPVQNAFVELFTGNLRDECLNLHWFRSLRHARAAVAAWRHHYNTRGRTRRSVTDRPRSS